MTSKSQKNDLELKCSYVLRQSRVFERRRIRNVIIKCVACGHRFDHILIVVTIKRALRARKEEGGLAPQTSSLIGTPLARP